MTSERSLYRQAFDTIVERAPSAPDFGLLGTVYLTPTASAKRRWPVVAAAVAAFLFALTPLILWNNFSGPASPGTTPGVPTTVPCATTTTTIAPGGQLPSGPPDDLGTPTGCDEPATTTTTDEGATTTIAPSGDGSG